jgi:hypothetical protein
MRRSNGNERVQLADDALTPTSGGETRLPGRLRLHSSAYRQASVLPRGNVTPFFPDIQRENDAIIPDQGIRGLHKPAPVARISTVGYPHDDAERRSPRSALNPVPVSGR